MKKHSKLFSLVLVLMSVVSIGFSVTGIQAFAATTPATQSSGGNGIKISPVRTDVTVKPGTSVSVMVTIQNVTSQPATFQAVINDFIAGSNENGQPSLILDSSKFAPSHSLKRYVEPIANIQVAAGESKVVKVIIDIPNDAAGGGYYGAIRFAPATQTGPTNVTLSASVGSLILARVPGDIKDNLSISSFDVRNDPKTDIASSFYTNNNSLYGVVRFQNNGNVQEQPFGKLTLKKGGKVLSSTEINSTDPKGNVLPGSIRRFSVNLDKVGSWGKYTIEGNFGYATNGQLVSASSSFYIVPIPLIIVLGILLIVIVGLIIWVPRALKRYNQKVIKRSRRR